MEHNSLEYDYIQLKTSETPDLWERIESGLERKEVANRLSERRFHLRKMVPLLGVIAASLLLIATLPMMISKQNSKFTDSWEEKSVENAADEAEAEMTVDSALYSERMPERILFEDQYYILDSTLTLDNNINLEQLTILGYIEAVENTDDIGNNQIEGATVYENTNNSIIINGYIYHLEVID